MRAPTPLAALVAAALVSVTIVAGCGGSGDSGSSTTASSADLGLITPGEIQVASDIPYAPFEFTEPGSDTVVGFDVDMVKEVATRIGVDPAKVMFVKQKFDTIILSVKQGKFDMSASSFSITPERAKQIDFSVPYFAANQSIMVKKGSFDPKTLDDLKGKTIGVQRGTTGAALAATAKGATLKQYEIIDDAFNALAQGRVDAVVNDFAVSAEGAQAKPELVVTAQIPTHEDYGMVFAKDKTALRAAFDTAIAAMKDDGTYATIYKKWFGSAPPAA